MTAATITSGPANRADRVASERVATLYRNAPVGVISALIGVALLSWILVYTDPATTGRVEVWFCFTLVVAICQMLLCTAYWRVKPPPERWGFWGWAFGLSAFVEGCRWGIGEIWLPAHGNIPDQLWVLLVASSSSASSVSSLGGYAPAFYALIVPASAPFIIWNGLKGDPIHLIMSLMVAVFSVSVALLGREQSRSLASALKLRFENLDLAEDLALQKDRAETANAAKTTFLASASHDLRQPLHALGMFVAALAGQPLDQVSRRLTDRIAESADAMNGLFNALLDVSQLDAGIITPHPEVFRIQPLLARICAEYAPQAEAKHLALTLHPCALSVRADPMLVEQILRNLVSNAVRYTERGRIVIGCRRSAARLTIGVWDTGPGIAPADQARIFQEFIQLGNPERDRTKGLGLGLAITQRVAALIDSPIALRSVLGRGSAFTLSLNLGAPADRNDVASPTESPCLVPNHGLVAIVDDEMAIRQGMTGLLEGWGYAVAAADCGPALLVALAERRPDLLICDWRLRGEETALSVIGSVRAKFGDTVPALLITGDTAAERLREAHATGLLLLHKPVAGGKLRAAIANLIRAAVGDQVA